MFRVELSKDGRDLHVVNVSAYLSLFKDMNSYPENRGSSDVSYSDPVQTISFKHRRSFSRSSDDGYEPTEVNTSIYRKDDGQPRRRESGEGPPISRSGCSGNYPKNRRNSFSAPSGRRWGAGSAGTGKQQHQESPECSQPYSVSSAADQPQPVYENLQIAGYAKSEWSERVKHDHKNSRPERKLTKDSGYETSPQNDSDYVNSDWVNKTKALNNEAANINIKAEMIASDGTELSDGAAELRARSAQLGYSRINESSSSKAFKPSQSSRYSSSDSVQSISGDDPAINCWMNANSTKSTPSLHHDLDCNSHQRPLAKVPAPLSLPTCRSTPNLDLDISTQNSSMVARRYKKGSVYEALASKSGLDFAPMIQCRPNWERLHGHTPEELPSHVRQSSNQSSGSDWASSGYHSMSIHSKQSSYSTEEDSHMSFVQNRCSSKDDVSDFDIEMNSAPPPPHEYFYRDLTGHSFVRANVPTVTPMFKSLAAHFQANNREQLQLIANHEDSLNPQTFTYRHKDNFKQSDFNELPSWSRSRNCSKNSTSGSSVTEVNIKGPTGAHKNSSTPLLDRLKMESQGDMCLGNGLHQRQSSVDSGAGSEESCHSSQETLKWHGSNSDLTFCVVSSKPVTSSANCEKPQHSVIQQNPVSWANPKRSSTSALSSSQTMDLNTEPRVSKCESLPALQKDIVANPPEPLQSNGYCNRYIANPNSNKSSRYVQSSKKKTFVPYQNSSSVSEEQPQKQMSFSQSKNYSGPKINCATSTKLLKSRVQLANPGYLDMNVRRTSSGKFSNQRSPPPSQLVGNTLVNDDANHRKSSVSSLPCDFEAKPLNSSRSSGQCSGDVHIHSNSSSSVSSSSSSPNSEKPLNVPRLSYLDPSKKARCPDPQLKAIQKQAVLSYYERVNTYSIPTSKYDDKSLNHRADGTTSSSSSPSSHLESPQRKAQSEKPECEGSLPSQKSTKTHVPEYSISSSENSGSQSAPVKTVSIYSQSSFLTPPHQDYENSRVLDLVRSFSYSPSVSESIPEKFTNCDTSPITKLSLADDWSRCSSPDLPLPPPPKTVLTEFIDNNDPLPPPPQPQPTSEMQSATANKNEHFTPVLQVQNVSSVTQTVAESTHSLPKESAGNALDPPKLQENKNKQMAYSYNRADSPPPPLPSRNYRKLSPLPNLLSKNSNRIVVSIRPQQRDQSHTPQSLDEGDDDLLLKEKLHNKMMDMSTQTTNSLSRKDLITPKFIQRKKLAEIECHQLSQDLVNHINDENLSKLLIPALERKTTADYIDNLFGEKFNEDVIANKAATALRILDSADLTDKLKEKANVINIEKQLPADSAYFTTSESKAKFLTRYNEDIMQEKNKAYMDEEASLAKKKELIASLTRKLEILKSEQIAIQEEINCNAELGKEVTARVKSLSESQEFEKFNLHIEEMGKIIKLLLSLSGRLARAENALTVLPKDSRPEEMESLKMKRDKLSSQYEEAKLLKECIDKRNIKISKFLQNYLSEEQYKDYDHFMKMKSKLALDARDIDDKIKLGEEQLSALNKSIEKVS
ncbi:Protein Shroom3 [Nymphon striatum]|nr:Protein Shroom3 [Nymphon striatum]